MIRDTVDILVIVGAASAAVCILAMVCALVAL
jgi:hypothetical protein